MRRLFATPRRQSIAGRRAEIEKATKFIDAQTGGGGTSSCRPILQASVQRPRIVRQRVAQIRRGETMRFIAREEPRGVRADSPDH